MHASAGRIACQRRRTLKIGRGTAGLFRALFLLMSPNKRVLCLGDLHVWPGPTPLAWQAFVNVAHEIRPEIILLGGDMVDGARVSRHAQRLGTKAPKLSEEVDELRRLLAMLPPCETRLWVWGNHDDRANQYLATHATELGDYAGTLQDRFPEWSTAWAFSLGENCEARHRFKGGKNAAYNNTLHSGISTITWHVHQQQVQPQDDRNGRRYGIEPGMGADPYGPQFEYGEMAPSRHVMGFALVSFDEESTVLPPELCEHSYGKMLFRGKTVAGESKPRFRVRARSVAA